MEYTADHRVLIEILEECIVITPSGTSTFILFGPSYQKFWEYIFQNDCFCHFQTTFWHGRASSSVCYFINIKQSDFFQYSLTI